MYIIIALILISIVLTARVANKWRLPLVVIALSAGVIFGSDVLGLVYFDDPTLAKRVADFALVFVLFVGGFGTKKEYLKSVLWPAMSLATLGVAITAAVATFTLNLIPGFGFSRALLLGCIISSTDAAAVFSVLRTRPLKQRLKSVVEIESAGNDPMAIVLTTTAVHIVSTGIQHPVNIGFSILWQLVGGVGMGLLSGRAGAFLFQRVKVLDRGYFYILLIGTITLAYGSADMVHASGMLSTFFAGYAMGNSGLPHRRTLDTFLEALSTIANVGIFVILGLLVFPRDFGRVWKEGIVLFAALTFLARPLAVLVCTSLSRYDLREKALLSWCGIRGAVPIVLATYPAAAGIESSGDIFNIVFFAVALSMLFQGTTLGKIADKLRLAVKVQPRPDQVMELVTVHSSDLEICEIRIDDEMYNGSVLVSSLSFPKGTTITMINRHEEVIAPQGFTEILPGDVLYILAKNTNVEAITSTLLSRFTLKNVAATEN